MAAGAALVIGLSLIVGCGSATKEDNAGEFREKMDELQSEVNLLPEDGARPGLVRGVATSKDGPKSRFVFSFGPVPEENLPEPANSGNAVWFNGGDEVYYWFEAYPFKYSDAKVERALKLRLEIENAACQAVAGRDCRQKE
jgi:hypothetical protein